jgi:AraC-like DNA-binding protein
LADAMPQPLIYNPTRRNRPFLQLAREAGVDVDTHLRRFGRTEQELLTPGARIPREQNLALLRALLASCADASIGLRAAERFDLTDLDVLGFLFSHAEHALGAFQMLGRFAPLVGGAVAPKLSVSKERVDMQFGLRHGLRQLPEVVDYQIGALSLSLQRLSEERPRPLAVQLARPRPARPAAYSRFFDAPVEFDAEVSKITYARTAALSPFKDASPRLREILAEHADLVLARFRRRETLADSVREEIEKDLGHQPSSAAVARVLGLSERTLRRRLQTEGDGFRELVDDVRRQRALALVGDGSLNVGEVAARCGFSDGAAFARAFKRWTGNAPSGPVRQGRDRRR